MTGNCLSVVLLEKRNACLGGLCPLSASSPAEGFSFSRMTTSKVILSLALAAALLAQTPRRAPKKAPRKAPAVEQYDPAHLPPGEVACGRERPGEVPCKCMEHRVKMSDAAQAECQRIADRTERAKCMVAGEACSMTPRDADHEYDASTGFHMPVQCAKSCNKARCLCCDS